MATDYTFFENTLHERRTYRFRGEQAAYHFGRLRACGIADELEVEGETGGEAADFTVAGTHLMNPGNPIGIAAINERFNITLPQEVDDFYRLWDGGVLLFQEVYPLLSVQEIIDVTVQYRDGYGIESNTSFGLIRFCDLSNSDFLAFRFNSEGVWEVVFKPYEYSDDYFMTHWDELSAGARFESSFRCWLERMMKTDGWPHGFQDDPYEKISPAQRIK